MKVPAFHTDRPEYPPWQRTFYHDKDTCPEGQRIMPGQRMSGTAFKRRCVECSKFS